MVCKRCRTRSPRRTRPTHHLVYIFSFVNITVTVMLQITVIPKHRGIFRNNFDENFRVRSANGFSVHYEKYCPAAGKRLREKTVLSLKMFLSYLNLLDSKKRNMKSDADLFLKILIFVCNSINTILDF